MFQFSYLSSNKSGILVSSVSALSLFSSEPGAVTFCSIWRLAFKNEVKSCLVAKLLLVLKFELCLSARFIPISENRGVTSKII